MSSDAARLQIALLGVRPPRNAGTISDHINAFRTHSRHSVTALQNLRVLYGYAHAVPAAFPLERFDALVLHYSNYLALESHMDRVSASRIRAFEGLKIVFIQDEYRTVDATVDALRNLGVNVLFTCVPDPEIDKVYPESRLPGVRKVSNLTGYVPEALVRLRVPPIAARPIDVGYRARKVPYWLGELGAEKWRIAPAFLNAVRGHDLRCDISYREEDRLYGRRWTDFILSCKTMLGVESGASVFDFDGSLQRETDRYLREHPSATFEEVQARFFLAHEHRIRLNQISPRSFEAAALRCGMVLFEGEYSGILKPWRHYVPLRKDFSNVGEVIDTIRDRARLQRMVDCAHEEIALNPAYTYRAFIERFDGIVEEEMGRVKRAATQAPERALRLRAALLNGRGVFSETVTRAWLLLPDAIRQRVKPRLKRLLEMIYKEKVAS
jgi:hypothetical protein